MKNKINFLKIDEINILDKKLKNSIIIKSNKCSKNISYYTNFIEFLLLFPEPKGWKKIK